LFDNILRPRAGREEFLSEPDGVDPLPSGHRGGKISEERHAYFLEAGSRK
jgi:hypothetical protein